MPFAEMRPGCYDPRRPPRRHGPQPHRAIAVLPDVPPLRRADVPRGEGQGPRARVRARVQRLDGRRVVRRQRRPAHPARASCRCGIPCSRPAEVRRNAARGVPRRSRSPSCPPTSGCRRSTTPTTTGTRCSPRATRRAPRSACTSARARRCRRRAPTRRRASAPRSRRSTRTWRWPTGCSRARSARFPNLKIAFSESQVGWMPFLLERLDRVFTSSRAWARPRPVAHRAAVELRARARVRLLLRRHGRRRRPPPDRHRAARVRDRLPAPGHDLAPHAELVAEIARAGHARRAREARAHQRDRDARPRPRRPEAGRLAQS